MNDESTAGRCLYLIAKHAPRLLRVGAAVDANRERPKAPEPIDEHARRARVLELRSLGWSRARVAYEVKLSMPAVSRIWREVA